MLRRGECHAEELADLLAELLDELRAACDARRDLLADADVDDPGIAAPGAFAVLGWPLGQDLVATHDMLAEGVHFTPDCPPVDIGWNDVGSWSALWEVAEQDGNGNAHHGDVVALDCRDTLAWGDRRLVAMIGLQDVVVVDTDDAVLVAHKNRVQDVKTVVTRLKAAGRSEPTLHRKVYRPWGAYDSIDMGERFQVKRITVSPGAALSLQMHHHRAEHWIVVSGTAEVTRGDEVLLLSENQSTYIPLGVTHRLRNPGKVPLELIEVQSGSYLGEDDIVRFEDVYGRG